MTDYHEPPEKMPEQDRDYVRALRSLIEEIDAVDWYQQRIVSCRNDELKAILSHNRDEEMEHASMVLEWLRRNMPGWDAQLRTYLFSEGDIPTLEDQSDSGGAEPFEEGLGIGGLRRVQD
jgi:ferritin-like protein